MTEELRATEGIVRKEGSVEAAHRLHEVAACLQSMACGEQTLGARIARLERVTAAVTAGVRPVIPS